MNFFLFFFDPWLISPFRWLPSPTAGYIVGVVFLALQCVILGDISATVVAFFNGKYLRKIQGDMDRHHNLSEQALMLGDKASYKAVNRQALDAFGHSFSLGAAIFCVSIWPMPFALAWLSLRFADAPLELSFSLPFLGRTVEYFPSFLLLYIVTRMIYSTVMSKCTWYSGLKVKITGQEG